jgi:hypothetical protein
MRQETSAELPDCAVASCPMEVLCRGLRPQQLTQRKVVEFRPRRVSQSVNPSDIRSESSKSQRIEAELERCLSRVGAQSEKESVQITL